MIISYFPAEHPFLRHLQAHAAFKMYGFVPYTYEKELAQKTTAFILFSPFEIEEKFVEPDHIWKKYFQEHYSYMKFFNLSIYPNENPNHLFLFDLPGNFAEKINKAKPLNEDWEPFVFGAVDARNQLHDFLAGHGGKSFYKPLYRLKSLLKDIQAERQKGVLHAEIWGELGADVLSWWNDLYTRFHVYQDFFAILPIGGEIESIRANLEQIRPFFAEKGNDERLLYDLHCLDALESIDETLKILHQYATH